MSSRPEGPLCLNPRVMVMQATSSFEVHGIYASLRFIQGYRYLDRCGEALIKLENVLEEGWITAETSPKSGNLKNDGLGMTATFNSEVMTVAQTEFISFEHFFDQTCKVYDTLWQLFEVKRINLPSIRVLVQKGFGEDELDQASRYVLNMRLCSPHPELCRLLGGKDQTIEFVFVTEEDEEWHGVRAHRRRRLQTQVIRQERQPPFDERMLRRTRQLGDKQKHAITALLQLRKQHPEIAPVAAQLDIEDSFETEFSAAEFDFPTFLKEAWSWAENVRNMVPRLGEVKS